MNTTTIYDLCVIGGGINGTGIAADAAGRDLKVYLCEQHDLANHTSSASSKLIHGGLRYLEYYEFRLVREALSEREVLLKVAPHLVQPLSLVIPHDSSQRPACLIRLGLFLYDTLGIRLGQKSLLPGSRGVDFTTEPLLGKPLKETFKKGFLYADCTVDDARLVLLNALAAHQQGATIATRTQLLEAKRQGDLWISTLQSSVTGETFSIQSRALVNATGPWLNHVIHDRLKLQTKHTVELVKGSHIVVPRFYEGDHAYLLQNTDKRVIFVIPYHQDFTMIGTTDLLYEGDPAEVTISPEEIDYLCQIVTTYFRRAITPQDVVNTWSGVRPLQAEEKANPSAVTRDYFLEVEDEQGAAPILSVFGGKITTYRRLAEHALQKLKPYFPGLKPDWTAHAPLPGGDFPHHHLAEFEIKLKQTYPWLPAHLATRYAKAYGTLCHRFLNKKQTLAELGQAFSDDLYEAEVRYLIEQEWAITVEDLLWRRTKLGLRFSAAQKNALENWLSHHA